MNSTGIFSKIVFLESTRIKLVLGRVGVMQIKGRVKIGKQKRGKDWNSWQKKELHSRF